MRCNMTTITETKITQSQTSAGVQQVQTQDKAPNSIMTVGQSGVANSAEETKAVSKLDELLEKLCADFTKYGITPDQIKQANVLSRISGLNETQLKNASEEEINRIIDCLREAIKDSIVDGKVDFEQAAKLGNKYHTALAGGWKSIESFKNANKKNSEDISARMERFFGLKEGSFAKLPQEKIEEYLERYFKQYFLDKVKHSKNPEETYRTQLRDFSKLLVNTPDEQKGIFRQAILSLSSSNKLKGLDAVLMSFDSQEVRTKWANECDDKYIEKLGTKPDCEGNVISKDDLTASVSKITANKDEEHIRATSEAIHQKAAEFFENNKDILERIKQKEANGEELTEEEQRIAVMRDYFIGAKSGEMSGTALNVIIEKSVKETLLQEMNVNAYELPEDTYKDIIKQLTKYIEDAAKNNPEALIMPKEDLVKLLDNATNGNYTNVLNNPENAVINTPVIDNNETVTVETQNYGISQGNQERYEQACQALECFKSAVLQEEKPQGAKNIVVEKTTTTDTKAEPTGDLSAAELSELDTSSFKKYFDKNIKEVASKYNKLISSAQKIVADKFAAMDDTLQSILLNSSCMAALRRDLFTQGNLDEKVIAKIDAMSGFERESYENRDTKNTDLIA